MVSECEKGKIVDVNVDVTFFADSVERDNDVGCACLSCSCMVSLSVSS
jgi:hypothetical protein